MFERKSEQVSQKSITSSENSSLVFPRTQTWLSFAKE